MTYEKLRLLLRAVLGSTLTLVTMLRIQRSGDYRVNGLSKFILHMPLTTCVS